MPRRQLANECDEWDLLYEAIKDIEEKDRKDGFCTEMAVNSLPSQMQAKIAAICLKNGIFPHPTTIQMHRPSPNEPRCAYCHVGLVSTTPS